MCFLLHMNNSQFFLIACLDDGHLDIVIDPF